MASASLSLRTFNRLFPDEEAARGWFEKSRWPNGPECPRCGLVDQACWLRSRSVWCCAGCRRQFTVKSGTALHRSHLGLLTWLQAIYLVVASSKGISALRLGQMLGVSYPTAWYLGHRIRFMMQQLPRLSGIVEIDETYAGAAPRKTALGQSPAAHRTGRGTPRPQLLVATERGGGVFTQLIPSHSRDAIAQALAGRLSDDAVVITDGLPAYAHLGERHAHLTVIHSQREYARTDAASGTRVHVNRAESYNAFLQRAVTGVWHRISARHLDRYSQELAFRWNGKGQPVLSKMASLLGGNTGILTYAALTG